MQLAQTISAPTRKTMTSSTLLDICLTSTPEKLITSRVVPITISGHYMIVIVRKINIHCKQNELLHNQSCVDKMWNTHMENTFYDSTRQACSN